MGERSKGKMMANSEKAPIVEGLLVSSPAQADTPAKLLLEKGVITDAESKCQTR